MKQIKSLIILLLLVPLFSSSIHAKAVVGYGRTFNLGLGAGYYGYAEHSIPLVNANYEFDLANRFTLAPFVSFYSYSDQYYWGNRDYPYRYYSYSETVIPVGLKGTFYFDDLLKVNSKWDLYLAGSLGVAIVNSTWDPSFYGDRNYYHRSGPLYLEIHVGSEYHINNKLGIYLDLSSGVSTIGLAIH